MAPAGHLRAATRGSALALWQTRHVAELLIRSADQPAADHRASSHDRTAVEEVVVSTVGDRRTDVPIHAMGGKGVFVKEVQAAVLDGRADFAVHSAKDLPAVTPEGLVLIAVPTRADARDALVGARWANLEPGARIATGSVRRRAQLAWLRPDLRFFELRGNIDTRLEKAAEFDAIVMAAAALDRLDRRPSVVDRLDSQVMVPQVGQGALAIECRADDDEVQAQLLAIEDPRSRRLVDAERAFLAELGGDCDLPAGAYGRFLDDDAGGGGTIELTATLASLDGQRLVRDQWAGDNPEQLGRSLARHLRDELDSPLGPSR